MERLSLIFMTMMQTRKQEDDQQEKTKWETRNVTCCLHEVLRQHGQFNEWNVTGYLKTYLMEAAIHKQSEILIVKEFIVLVKQELRASVAEIVTTSEGWNDFDSKMKEKFQAKERLRSGDPDKISRLDERL